MYTSLNPNGHSVLPPDASLRSPDLSLISVLLKFSLDLKITIEIYLW